MGMTDNTSIFGFCHDLLNLVNSEKGIVRKFKYFLHASYSIS